MKSNQNQMQRSYLYVDLKKQRKKAKGVYDRV